MEGLDGCACSGQEDRLCRVGELRASLLDALEQLEVDRLLGVHVEVVVGIQHPVDGLEAKRGLGERHEVRAVETRERLLLDDLADDRGNAVDSLGRGVVGDVELEHDPPLLHPLVIADAALEQIVVRHDDLLAAETADAGRLEPDMLHGAEHVVDDDEVADDKWFVEHDRERREQITENVLYRQRDRDAADAQPRDERGDVDAEGAQRHDEENRPERETGRVADRLHGGARAAVGLTRAAKVVLDAEANQSVAPAARLEQDDDHHDQLQDAARLIGQDQETRRGVQRHHEQEVRTRSPDDVDADVVYARRRTRRECAQPVDEHASRQRQRDVHTAEHGDRDEPLPQGVGIPHPIQEFEVEHER